MVMGSDDAVIVGAGLVGKALALALAQAGQRVRLCGVHPAPVEVEGGYAQRVYAFNAASRAFLERLRAWDPVPLGRVQAVQRMHIAADGAALEFDAYRQGVEALAWIVESDAIERALDLALRFERGVHCSEARVEQAHREAGAWHLRLSDGTEVSTALLLGADGRHSRVRTWAGLGLRSKPYGQQAVVCNFTCARTHAGAAFQAFGPDGVIALLPLAPQQARAQVSLVWSAPDALAAELVAQGPERLAQRVCERLPALGAQSLGHLDPAGAVGSWPLVLQRAHSLVGDGVALLGDAGHVLHPMAGHGLNLGLQDVQALAATVAARGSDARALRAFARARAEQVLALELATDGLHRLYAPGLAWLAPLRALGMAATNNLTPVKRWLAGYASGVTVLS